MGAFNNDIKFQDQLVEMAVKHRLKDEYIKGTYGKQNGQFKGCSIGCIVYDVNRINDLNISTDDHSKLAISLDIPEFILRLADSIFEGLPEPLNLEWTERWISAIPTGVDLNPVLPRFLLKTLDQLPEIDRTDVVNSINGVKQVLQNWADTGEVNIEAAARASEAAAWEQIADNLISCIEELRK